MYTAYDLAKIIYEINEGDLPTNAQVLVVLICISFSANLNIKFAMTMTIQEVMFLWAKAALPAQNMIEAVKKLEKLYEEWQNVKKNDKKIAPAAIKEREEFSAKILDYFDVTDYDIFAKIKFQKVKKEPEEERYIVLEGLRDSNFGIGRIMTRAGKRKLIKELEGIFKYTQAARLETYNNEDGKDEDKENTLMEDAHIVVVASISQGRKNLPRHPRKNRNRLTI